MKNNVFMLLIIFGLPLCASGALQGDNFQYTAHCRLQNNQHGMLLMDNHAIHIAGLLLPHQLGLPAPNMPQFQEIISNISGCFMDKTNIKGNKYHRITIKLASETMQNLVENGLAILHDNDAIWLWNLEQTARDAKKGIWGYDIAIYSVLQGFISNWTLMNNVKYQIRLTNAQNAQGGERWDIIIPKKFFHPVWTHIKNGDYKNQPIMARGFRTVAQPLTITHQANIMMNDTSIGFEND